MMTTSASSFDAIALATVAPTAPAPPTTVTFLFIYSPRVTFRPADTERGMLHIANHCVGELGCLELGGAGHQPREVVGDLLGGDRAIHALDEQIGGLHPSHVAQHHLTRQNHRSGIDLVQIGV